jgi:hypothetical protein
MITFTYKTSNNTHTHLLLYDDTTSIYKTVYQFNDMKSGIIIADLGETRGLDFVFFDEESKSRKYLYFDENSKPIVKDFKNLISQDKAICDRGNIHLNYRITQPHSSAFVDIDGDCINDLLVMSNYKSLNQATNATETKYYLEIWRGRLEDNQIKYCLTQSSVYQIDEKLGLFSLADIDRDSMLDIVFPIKNSSPPQILIAYNKVALEYDWTQDYCATHSSSTSSTTTSESDTNVKKYTIPLVFDEFRLEGMGSSKNKILQLTDIPTQTFYSSTDTPAYLRFGDINQDSYPDFTVVLQNKADYTQTSYVFLNTAIIDQLTNQPIETQRTFSNKKAYVISKVQNAIYSSFFDMDEDGKLDLIIVKQESNNLMNTEGYYNTHVYDSFYLKSLVLNEKTSFFGNEFGTSFRFITTNIDGSRRMDFASQGIQVNTPLSLNLPYAVIGIGRSNNYIENFHIISGNYVESSYNYKMFTPIIPNSQIVVRHYKNENYYAQKNSQVVVVNSNNTVTNITDNSNNTTVNPKPVTPTSTEGQDLVTWHLDLIVKPTSKLSILITMIIIILTGLFFGIAYLHIQETKEDTAENQREFQFW